MPYDPQYEEDPSNYIPEYNELGVDQYGNPQPRGAFYVPGQGDLGKDNYVQHWNTVFRTDPIMQQIFNSPVDEKTKEALATSRAQELGWTPANGNWSVDYDKDGFRTEESNFFNQTKPLWYALGATALGGGVAGALGAGGAAAADIPTIASTNLITSATGSLAPTISGIGSLGAAEALTLPTITSLTGAPIVAGGTSAAAPAAAGTGAAASTAPTVGASTASVGASVPEIASRQIGNGMGTMPNVAGGTANLGGGSWISKLLGGDKQDWADLGSLLGNLGQAESNNRENKGNFAQQYDRNALLAAENRRRDESDAMRKLAQAGWINNRPDFAPPTIQLNGAQRTAPSFPGVAPAPISAAQKQGANTLEGQMLQRLQPGGSYQLQPLSSYADRGTLEKIGMYGGLGAGAIGAAKDIWNIFD